MTIDLSVFIDDIIDGLGDIAQEFNDDKLILRDLNKAYKFIYLISKKYYKDQMDLDNISEIEGCLTTLALYYSYRTWTMTASADRATMPETSAVQMNYLMEDARNCLTWISAVPLDENLQPKDYSISKIIGAIRGPTALN